MNIFNSLGSNYDIAFALKALFGTGSKETNDSLQKFLSDRYGGQVILTYKGREALTLALKALQLPKSSYIAINGFTCYAVFQAIHDMGLRVEFIDVGKNDLNFTPQSLTEKLKANPKIRAVIVQNTLGFPAQVPAIAKLCRAKNIVLIEDLAHSIGAQYADGAQAGAIGNVTILSFSQDKIIDGISGGAVIVRDKRVNSITASSLKQLTLKTQLTDRMYPLVTFLIRRLYPLRLGKPFHALLKSLNLLSTPMDDATKLTPRSLPGWYSKLILSQFDQEPDNLSHRREIASVYAKNLKTQITSKTLIKSLGRSASIRFPIFVKHRQNLIAFLKSYGIYVSDIWYDAPVSPKRYLKKSTYRKGCPEAEAVANSILNLPTHRHVSKKDALAISALINQWHKSPPNQ